MESHSAKLGQGKPWVHWGTHTQSKGPPETALDPLGGLVRRVGSESDGTGTTPLIGRAKDMIARATTGVARTMLSVARAMVNTVP